MKIKSFKEKILTLILMIAIILFMYFCGITCFWKLLFKIPCPGCGMTRAYISLLSLDFQKAFDFHPMFWSVPILGIFYFTDGKIFKQKWLNTAIITIILIGFLICWILNLIEYF